MDFQDLVNQRRGLPITNMNFTKRHYTTSSEPRNYSEPNQEILKGVATMNTVLQDYNILGNPPIVSDKAFKSYGDIRGDSVQKGPGPGVLNMFLSKTEKPIERNTTLFKMVGVIGISSFSSPSLIDNFCSTSSSSSAPAYVDTVDGVNNLEKHIQTNLSEQMRSINITSSQDVKLYCGLDHCQNTSGQSNTADINGEALGRNSQCCDGCRDILSLCSESSSLLFPVNSDVYSDSSDVKIVCSTQSSTENIHMLCSSVSTTTTMEPPHTWHSASPPSTLDNSKLARFQIKYQFNQSDNKIPEKTSSSVTSKFLQQVRDRKAEASQNELRNKKPLDTGNSVTSCEDKIARLKEMLSKKQQSYNVDELKQVPRNKSKDVSPCRNPEIVHSSTPPLLPDAIPSAPSQIEEINKQVDSNLSVLVDTPEHSSVNCFHRTDICNTAAATDESIVELGKLMDKLSLSDDVHKKESLINEAHITDTPSVEVVETMPNNINDQQSCPKQTNSFVNKTIDDSIHNQITNHKNSMEIPKSIENNSLQETHSIEDISKSSSVEDNSTIVVPVSVPEQAANIPQETVTLNTGDLSEINTLLAKADHIDTTKLEKIENIVHLEKVSSDHSDKNMTNTKDLVPNNNHTVVTPGTRHEKKSKRTKIQKNHRLAAVKLDESTVQAGECGNENLNALQERLSPGKERHTPHNKVCNKKHKNEHCMKKHRHKAKESFKKDIRDDLNYDSNTETSDIIYFSPDSLQLHTENKKTNKKIKTSKILMKNEASPQGQEESTNRCRLTESMEKCVNFISKLPSQMSPVYKKLCNGNSKERLSSTESEDCQGFDEIKGKFKSNSSESDDSFVIVFSDGKKEDPTKQPSNLKPENMKQRVRLPSECDSEDSFVICFEGDGSSSVDDCYGNDEIYSDSESTSGSDMESDTDSEGDEMNSDLSSDECETVMEQPPKLKSCLKRRSSPKLEKPPVEKKVNFNPKPEVHKMIVWAHAYRQARIGPWERYGRDAERFKQRIRDTSVCLEWVFNRQHRNRIFFQRFRPFLMRAIREEKEAKAREAKRLKEEEEKKRIEMEQEQERLRLEEEEKKKLQIEENLQEPEKGNENEIEKINPESDKTKDLPTFISTALVATPVIQDS